MPRGHSSPEHIAKMLAARNAKRALITPEMRFWSKVDKRGPDECWPWIGGMGTHGYGVLYWKGRVEPGHRVSMDIHGVEMPEGMFVDHICRNRPCVNPAHLRVVTPTVNGLENNSNPWAKNKGKTHCKHGHEFTEESTRWTRHPGSRFLCRNCKICGAMDAKANKRAKELGLEPRPEWLAKHRRPSL